MIRHCCWIGTEMFLCALIDSGKTRDYNNMLKEPGHFEQIRNGSAWFN